MLISGVAMKQIQEWLGHSDFSTTANIYAHLDYNSKLSSAEAMLAGLGLKGSEAKKTPPDSHQTEFGGSGGIRTHGPVSSRPNDFESFSL